jgi:uncharacterized protein
MMDTIWLALALMLVCEGIMPFTQPARWRRWMLQLASLPDRQIRLLGFGLMMAGLLSALWLR